MNISKYKMACFTTAVSLVGVCAIVCWWWLPPITTSIDRNPTDVNNKTAVAAVTSNTLINPNPSIKKPYKPTAIIQPQDYFEEALKLHKLALEGHPASQLALGNILEICVKVAYERETLHQNLQLLYTYSNMLPTGVLQQLDQSIQRCAHFYPENLQLFFPHNERYQSLSQPSNEKVNWHENELLIEYDLPMTWKSLAAASGDEQAVIEIIQPLPNQIVNIDNPHIKNVLSRQLQTGNPDLLLRISNCLPPEQTSTRVALMEMACEQTSGCQKMKQFDNQLILQLRTFGEVSQQASSLADIEQGLIYFDLPGVINTFKNSDTLNQNKGQHVQNKLKDPTFRASLIEHCAVHMRPSNPSQ